MTKVKIIGAGSIGNHLAHACRNKNWQVIMTDKDQAALERTQYEIYPNRYAEWDETISLQPLEKARLEMADIVIIGTPPNTHIPIALDVLENESPRIILIEKPLCGPDLTGCEHLLNLAQKKNVTVLVGYNHTLTQNTLKAEQVLKEQNIGPIKTITSKTREHWGGIFAAHPWLDGPKDSYLGYYKYGGGACGEHSHAINIWQHFAHSVGAGRIEQVSATLDIISDGVIEYDQLCLLSLKTEEGLMGDVAQDVITTPTEKMARLQGENGFLEWHVSTTATTDELITQTDQEPVQKLTINKTRPDDFKGEIDHIEDLLKNTSALKTSPISLERGLETMMVIAAAFHSHASKKHINIDWTQGYNLSALS